MLLDAESDLGLPLRQLARFSVVFVRRNSPRLSSRSSTTFSRLSWSTCLRNTFAISRRAASDTAISHLPASALSASLCLARAPAEPVHARSGREITQTPRRMGVRQGACDCCAVDGRSQQ